MLNRPIYLNLANLISLLRLVLLPVFFYFLIYYLSWREGEGMQEVAQVYYWVTIALAPLILATDFLDGWVARRFELVNPLGAFLDPLADKFFAFFTMLILAGVGNLPLWLVMVVFFKEIFILIGWVLLFILGYDTEIQPSALGKAATVCQGTLVYAAILTLPDNRALDFYAFPLSSLAELINRFWFQAFTAALTALSGVVYIMEGLHRSQRVEPKESAKVAVLKVGDSHSGQPEAD